LGQKEIASGEKLIKFYCAQNIREIPSSLWQHKMAFWGFTESLELG